MFLNILIFCLLTIETLESDHAHPLYSYDIGAPNGPANWVNLSSTSQCNGRRQSPIDIDKRDVVVNNQLGFVEFNKELTGTRIDYLVNVGMTVGVKMDGLIRTISGGGLDTPYRLYHFHMHWSSNSLTGSEHSIDQRFSPLEIHFVHWNADKYPNIRDAMKEEDGLAVLGVLVQIKDPNNKEQIISPGLAKIAEYFEFVKKSGSEFMIPNFSFASLFPLKKNYYRYLGSLTTPNCLESVKWTVFRDPIYATEEILEALRNVDLDFDVFTTNSRPTQPINGRQVFGCCDEVPARKYLKDLFM